MKPRIMINDVGQNFISWVCKGFRPPYRYECYGFGSTPAEAYERWASTDVIPF